jgi:hypothetical protein
MTGKTTFMGTWPDPGFIHFDPNTPVVANQLGPVVVVESWPHFRDHIVPAIVSGRWKGVRTVCVDSLTYACRMSDEAAGVRGKASEGAAYTLSRIEFSQAMQRLLTVARFPSVPAPAHVLCSVHETEKTDRDGSVRDIVPAVTGQLKDQLAGWFDFVFLASLRIVNRQVGTRIERVAERYLSTIPVDTMRPYIADRVGGKLFPGTLPAEVSPPTYQRLAELWEIPSTHP